MNIFGSDAPASYPFLWNTPKQSSIQWNGIGPQNLIVPAEPEFGIPEFDGGALLRNITEVIGVFASIDVSKVFDEGGYNSSLRTRNMMELEALVGKLTSPPWPENILPLIVKKKAADGKKHYDDHCIECHKILPSQPSAEFINIEMKSIFQLGTDIWLACNTVLHRSKSGYLERDGLAEVEDTFEILLTMSSGAGSFGLNSMRKNSKPSSIEDERRKRLGKFVDITPFSFQQPNLLAAQKPTLRQQREEACRRKVGDARLKYKGGPLHGIWATAPYLHNGSVPTLYDLLLPTASRKPVFRVGGTEFDPKDVGFKSEPDNGPFVFRVRNEKGVPIPGNSNAGHEYGTKLTETQRRELLEYLKTL